MSKENIYLDFRIEKIDETRKYLLEEIKNVNLMGEHCEKVYRTLNYFEYFLICTSPVTDCVSIPASASVAGVPVSTGSSAVGLKICALTAGIKMYQSIIRKKNNNSIVSKNQVQCNLSYANKAPKNLPSCFLLLVLLLQ